MAIERNVDVRNVAQLPGAFPVLLPGRGSGSQTGGHLFPYRSWWDCWWAAFMNVWSKFKTTTLFITHDVEEAIFLADHVGVITARPGRMREILPVDIPPRFVEVNTEPHFVNLKREILSTPREECALRGA